MKKTADNLFPNWIYILFILTRSICLACFVLLLLIFFIDEDFITVLVKAFELPFSMTSVYIAIILFQFFNSIHSLIILFLVSIAYYIALNVAFKDKQNSWVDVVFFTFLSFIVFNYILTKQDVLSILILAGIYSLTYKLNKIDFNNFTKHHHVSIFTIPLLIPFVFELFFSSYIIYFLRNIKHHYLKAKIWDHLGGKISMVLGANILAFIAINLFYPTYYLPKGVALISKGTFYGMQIDESSKRLFACNNQENNLYIFDLNHLHYQPRIMKIFTSELERLKINEEKREFYHFDRGDNRLLIYDLDNYKLKRVSTCKLDGSGSAKVSFDNKSQTIVVVREDDFFYILDMQTLLPKKKIELRKIDYVVHDINTNMYVASTFQDSENIYFVSPQGQGVFKIQAKSTQAELCISNKRKELYVCFPFLSEIFVYDLNNFKLKRKISTVFGAKHIACDDMNDFIVVSSICSGFVDIINLNNEKHSKIFVGYYLREVCLNKSKREAFISSFKSGIFKINY